jgi:hypothetical protein
LRQNPNGKEVADALERAVQELKSREMSSEPQTPPGGAGIRPRTTPGEGAKAGRATPEAGTGRKTPHPTLSGSFKAYPLAAAEAALKKLRANPGDRQAAEALEQALKALKEQRKPNGPVPAPPASPDKR